MQREILIKFGEIYLKGRNKKFFESAFIHNIENKLKKFENVLIKNTGSVVAVSCEDPKKILPEIGKIFGVSSFASAVKTDKNMEEICAASERVLTESHVSRFKIEAKRADKSFYLTSPEICNIAGKFLSEKTGISVDVNNPELTIKIEIRNGGAYIISESYCGLGGLPHGTSGHGTLLISGGIDSPVAGFMMAKRGLELTAVHFASPPFTNERACEKAERLIGILSEYCGSIKFYTVILTNLQKTIKKTCPDELFTIISRRIMNKISEKIALKESCSCLITGESLGQVASQTVPAMTCTAHNIGIPIFRPLIGMDKNEIVKAAEKIGTFEISIEPFDDCCSMLSPKHPKINPNLEFVESVLKKIQNLDDLIESAIKNMKIKIINQN
jgi:thiamine biosynthesis protein ThiI